MSVPARLVAIPPAFQARWALSGLGWIGVAAFVALLEALAAFIDWKLGLVFAVALAVGAVVTSRPVLLLPLCVITVYLEGLTFSGAAVTRLLAPGALLLVLLEVLRGTGRIRLGAPLAWVSAYVLWAIASGLWTEAPEGTRFLLQSLAIALVFLGAFAAMVSTEADLRRLLYVLAFTSAGIGGLSVLAFAGLFGQEAEALPHLELLQAGRSQGAVDDPDFFAAMQIAALPLVLVLASQARDRRMQIVLYGGVIAIIASIFTSLSRGGFIGIVVLGLLLLAANPERVFRSRREKGITLLIVALGMGAFFSRPFVRDEVFDRVSSIYAPKTRDDESGSGRTNLWKAAARTAEQNPILGIGYGTFPYVSEELIYHTPGVDLEVYGGRREGDNFVAHNTYLGTAAEIGITGLLLYLGVIFSTIVSLRRTAARAFAARKPFVGRVAHALVLGLAGWSVATLFLSAETARMFWIIVGLSLALPKVLAEPEQLPEAPREREGIEPRRRPVRVRAAVLPRPSFAHALAPRATGAPAPPAASMRPPTPDVFSGLRGWHPSVGAIQLAAAIGIAWALGLLALILLS